MSFFTQQTRVVEIDALNRVTVRKLTYAQQQAVLSAAMTFKMSMQTGQTGQAGQTTTGEVDPFRLNSEKLFAAIVSWEGEGFEGRPVTRENIGALPLDVVAIIQAAVDELNADMSDAEKKDSASITSMD